MVELSSKVEFAIEPWGAIWPEASALMTSHYGLVTDRTFDEIEVDDENCQILSDAGVMQIATARRNAGLVGYCIWFLAPNLGVKGRVEACQGPWYAEPGTSIGLRLFKFSISDLKTRLGIKTVYPHRWARSPDRLESFFSRLGAKQMEIVYKLDLDLELESEG